ncbi:hypothetical protein Nepgr_008238 [Nepenthes gracilis]|uniref:Uncharacterized protein n=1 Tax=Nepenthes gracilis TaxID=150966 RepID=A0AAD3S8L6_NEPGR|nr:hypothetical protein Nepgr_008238 [Nepenthes gracilis]
MTLNFTTCSILLKKPFYILSGKRIAKFSCCSAVLYFTKKRLPCVCDPIILICFSSLKVTACDLAKGYARGGCSYPSSVMMQSDSKAYVIPYDGYRLNLEAAVLNQSKQPSLLTRTLKSHGNQLFCLRLDVQSNLS